MTLPAAEAAPGTVLRRITSKDAPRAIYSAVCLMCGTESMPVDDEPLPVQAWTLTHTKLNPDHRHFKIMTETFWRVDTGPDGPSGERQDVRGAEV
ncbi:hypothetical protein GCM10027168_45300 [Streptomyces capparidis]